MAKSTKIQQWLNIGKRRFSEEGIKGINIQEMSVEMKVAKTSFYHFFSTRDEFLNQLFNYWEYDGTDRIIALFDQIGDPIKRMHAIFELVNKNKENEFFYYHLKLYSKDNPEGRKFIDNADLKRGKQLFKIFKELEFSDTIALKKSRLMKTVLLGRFSLMMGYVNDEYDFNLSKNEILEMMGIKEL